MTPLLHSPSRTLCAALLAVLLTTSAVMPLLNDRHAVSALAEHYREHAERDHISFFEFLLVHYNPASPHNQHQDAHSKQHHGLPLHCANYLSAVAVLPIIGNPTFAALSARALAPYDPRYSFPILYFSIFQPPKV
jgi:hypothetical protein